MNQNNCLSLGDKLNILGLEGQKVSVEYINFLCENLETTNKKYGVYKNNIAGKNIKYSKKDKTDPKYVILLKLINKILTNINRSNITDLTEFKNVDQDDIIRTENIMVYNEMEKEIFKYFDKVECGWYRRNRTKNYLLTFLRFACAFVGLTFIYDQKNKVTNSVIKTHILHSIQ